MTEFCKTVKVFFLLELSIIRTNFLFPWEFEFIESPLQYLKDKGINPKERKKFFSEILTAFFKKKISVRQEILDAVEKSCIQRVLFFR